MAETYKLGVLAKQKAEAFRDECGLSVAQATELERSVALIGAGWAEGSVTDAPLWRTDLTDDGTPFEFSLSFKGNSLEARVLAEPQQAPFDAHSNWRAGLAVNAQLRAEGRSLDRFDAVESLFAPGPSDAAARFAIWHATAIARDGSSRVKVYVNPQVHGATDAPDLVQKALETLGLSAAWSFLSTRLDKAELIYFSLDLEASSSARVKVYLAYPDADLAQLERALEGGRHHIAGDATKWVRGVTTQGEPYEGRPLLVCWAFDAADPRPRATLHVPVRSYNANDAEALEGVIPWLGKAEGALLQSALPRIAGRPLNLGRGFITYVSFQYESGALKVTMYFAPQTYAIGAPRESGVLPKRPRAKRTMQDIDNAIARHADSIHALPFLVRIPNASIEEIRALAAHLTFWVLAFQDVMRLGGRLVSDPSLMHFAHTHAAEDHGHEQWFLNDVAHLGAERDLRWSFGPEHAQVRDIAYVVISEVMSARSDHARIAVLLCLEASGTLFFNRIVSRLDALGFAEHMQYFGRLHQQVEAAHDIFDGDAHARWEQIPMSDADFAEANASVVRTFEAMGRLAEHLHAEMNAVAEQEQAAE